MSILYVPPSITNKTNRTRIERLAYGPQNFYYIESIAIQLNFFSNKKKKKKNSANLVEKWCYSFYILLLHIRTHVIWWIKKISLPFTPRKCCFSLLSKCNITPKFICGVFVFVDLKMLYWRKQCFFFKGKYSRNRRDLNKDIIKIIYEKWFCR